MDLTSYISSTRKREFIAFWLGDGLVLAGMKVNIWDVTDAIAALVRSGTRVGAARLADLRVALEDLSASAAHGAQ